MYKLCFFVPEAELELVKKAVFASGAGQIGNYDHCCWQVLGEGQFRPLQGSQPAIGALGSLERVPEYRVELVCDDDKIAAAVAALKRAHPYEEVAYDVIKLADI
ncbi:YqfO family protein [Motiliproteus sediminis]|uniref:Nif3-like dinuclear metal center hexameric protein n=1 Tax=Motiliproteus sediminis TaxID=1468178 RepID=UPI001AEF39C7|nr:YqfO family protein [Motiliproteus sediminis]